MEKSEKYIFDIEVFPNYFCVVLKKLDKNQVFVIDSDNFNKQKYKFIDIVSQNILISYGGHGFDDIIINELLKYRNVYISKGKLNKKIREIRDNRKSQYKNINYDFYSYDLAQEYELKVGVKGFEFNRGYGIKEQDAANFNYSIKKNRYNVIVEEVIAYCLQDVIATEKMYRYIMKKDSRWHEKEKLLDILTKNKYSNTLKLKDKIKYLRYSNDELATLLLNGRKLVKNSPKFEMTSKNYPFIKNYNNLKKSQVYKLSISEDFLYNYLLKRELIKNPESEFLMIQIPKKIILEGTYFRKIINKYKRIIIKKLNKSLKNTKVEIVHIFENDIFLSNITETSMGKLEKIMQNEFKNIFSSEKIDKLIKNNKKAGLIYKIGEKTYATENFYFSYLTSPRMHLWLIETVKNYFWENMSIKNAVLEVFKRNRNLFFMYMAANESIYSCDENGVLTYNFKYNLPKFKKYRLYFSKTGTNKVINRKHEKYNEKFGFGNINGTYYKVRHIVSSVEEFENYDDMDMESYIEYAKNYIEQFLL